jgi:hypothetical protein
VPACISPQAGVCGLVTKNEFLYQVHKVTFNKQKEKIATQTSLHYFAAVRYEKIRLHIVLAMMQ